MGVIACSEVNPGGRRLLQGWLVTVAGLLAASARSVMTLIPGFVTLADHLTSRRCLGCVLPQPPIPPQSTTSVSVYNLPFLVPLSRTDASRGCHLRCLSTVSPSRELRDVVRLKLPTGHCRTEWQGWTMTDGLRTGVIWLVIDVVWISRQVE